MKFDIKITDNSSAVRTAAEKQIEQAVRNMASAWVKNAQANTPVDTGNLRDSITYDAEGDKAVVGSNVDYALAVELRDMGHRVGKAHFLRDSGQDYADEYKKIAEDDLKG